MTKLLRKLRRLLGNKQEKEMSRGDIMMKAARGSAYAIRRHHGTLDKLAEYDRSK